MERLMILGGPSHPNSIGQRCDILEITSGDKTYRLMIDCGMEFVREDEIGGRGPSPDFSLLGDGQKIDALLLTHSHVDHCGSIAVVVRKNLLNENANIFTTPQTAAVLPIVLQDGLKQNAPFNVLDAVHTLFRPGGESRVTAFPQPGEFELFPGFKIFTAPAGHIPGACSLIIPTYSGKKGLITGDICWHDQPLLKGAPLPSRGWPREWIPDEIWGTDLTYGGGTKKPLAGEVKKIVSATKKALGEGKKVVIAAFGNGRGQNIAVWLAKAGIPVWIDGVIRDMYEIFRETKWSSRDNQIPALGKKIFRIANEDQREEFIHSPEPRVFITTGGMGDFGPIVRYMEELLPDKNACFFFTSWLAPGTNGEKLLRKANRWGEQYLRLINKYDEEITVPVRAAVERFSLSAHADLSEFTAFVGDIVECRGGKPLDRIVLTHGLPQTKAEAAHKLLPFTKEIVYGERNTIISLN